MGLSIKTKNIKITLNQQQKKDLMDKLHIEFSQKPHNSIDASYIKKNVDFSNEQNLEFILQYLNIEFKTKKDSIKLVSQNIKLTLTFVHSIFWEALEDIVDPGSYVTWSDDLGGVFGKFYGFTTIDFDGYKELKELNNKFILKRKLESNLSITSVQSLKNKI